jgi:FkbM family methyltransferase
MKSKLLRHRLYWFLHSLPVLGRVVARVANWQYHWQNHPTQFLRRAIGRRDNLFVVEIGSNDGKSGDPIYPLLRRHRSWQALFIEPVPFLFEQLQRTHGQNPRFRYEQVAIADRRQTMPFYYVSQSARREVPYLPAFVEQLGSFYRANIEKHMSGPLDRFIVELSLEAVPLADVLDRQRVDRIDILLIDTEGHDWEILRQFDLQRYSPLVIFFEHKHLAPEDKAASRDFLRDYDITDVGHDYLCRRR